MIQLDSALEVQIAKKVMESIEDEIREQIQVVTEDIFDIGLDNLQADYLQKRGKYVALKELETYISQLKLNTSRGGVDE